MRLKACLPRWDAASSTESTLPVLGAARMQPLAVEEVCCARLACSPRWDAASSTDGRLPVQRAARMQVEKLTAQRGSAEDDGGD